MNNPRGFFLLCHPNGIIESVVKDDFAFFNLNGGQFYQIFSTDCHASINEFLLSVNQSNRVERRTLPLENNTDYSNIQVLAIPLDKRVAVLGAGTNEELFVYYNIVNRLLSRELTAAQGDAFDKSAGSNSRKWEEEGKTDLLTLQEKLDQKQSELREKNKELDQFAHIISHDLKAPLSQSKLIVHLLKKKMDLEHASPEIKQLFDMLILSTNHMSGLIDSINAYAQSGDSEDSVGKFKLEDLYNDVLSEVKPPGQMIFRLPDNMPSIVANRLQLQQILIHLVNNAIKFHHLEKGEVTLTFEELPAEYRFGVKDDGPGIPDDYHRNIFQIFNQVHRKHIGEGSGVGLSIVKKLVENVGGHLSLDSKVGSGSHFYFTWPKLKA